MSRIGGVYVSSLSSLLSLFFDINMCKVKLGIFLLSLLILLVYIRKMMRQEHERVDLQRNSGLRQDHMVADSAGKSQMATRDIKDTTFVMSFCFYTRAKKNIIRESH